MKIMERRFHRVHSGKRQELREVEFKFDAIEERLGGFPAKRRYWCYTGSNDLGTFVWEREWESMAEMEAAYVKLSADPETKPTQVEIASLVEFGPAELYVPWD